MAFLNKGLTIKLIDERADRRTEDEEPPSDTFRYDEGLIDFVKFLTGSKETIHPSVIAIDACANKCEWPIRHN